MQRTNIYLESVQCLALDELARAQGTSRAELIRRLLDRALADQSESLAGDLAAIDESFGTLHGEDVRTERSPDQRAEHLREIGPA